MSDSQVELVKRKTDIVAIVDARVKLNKAGRNFKALCPFHGEKTPSFFVSSELQTFKCFGCGEGGDVFSFLQKYEGMSFPEALEYLATKAGVELKQEYRSGEELKKKRLMEIMHLSQEYYHYLLTGHKVGRKALNYLKNRGIGQSLIKTFGLGYAPESWDGLQKYLVGKKKYRVEELLEVGMVIRRQGAGGYYDRFRGRVMFPLKDMRGRILGFSGRVMEAEVKGAHSAGSVQAKYINSPETSLYHKSEMLYGLYEARSFIKKKDRVVVVEGELDMMSSYQAGVKETVAIKGSALTEGQVQLLRRLTGNVILALDADVAGDEATKRGIEVAEKLAMNLSVAEVEGGKDPDELARKNPEKWRELVKKPVSVWEFLVGKVWEKYEVTTGEGKRKASRELAKILSRITNAVEREHYVKLVAKKMKVSEKVVEEEVVKAEKLPAGREKEEQVKEVKKELRKDRLEQYLVGLWLQMRGNLKEMAELLDESLITDVGLKKVWRQIKELLDEKPKLTVKEIVASLEREQQRLVEGLFTTEVIMLTDDEDRLKKVYRKGVADLEQLSLKAELLKLSAELTGLEGEEGKRAKVDKLQAQMADVTGKLKQLRSE